MSEALYVNTKSKKLSESTLRLVIKQISESDDKDFTLVQLEKLKSYYPDIIKISEMVRKDKIDFKNINNLTVPKGLKEAIKSYYFNSRQNAIQAEITYIPRGFLSDVMSVMNLAITYTRYFKIVNIPLLLEVMGIISNTEEIYEEMIYEGDYDYNYNKETYNGKWLLLMFGAGNKYVGISGGIGYGMGNFSKYKDSNVIWEDKKSGWGLGFHIYFKCPIYVLRLGMNVGIVRSMAGGAYLMNIIGLAFDF